MTNTTIRLRHAQPGDEDAVAKVHVASWQAAYRGLLPDSYLDALDPLQRASRYSFAASGSGDPVTTVAVDGNMICGFATTSPSRDADLPGIGELTAIYVHPGWWSRGVGRDLLGAARSRLAAQGYSAALLWVMVGNERAEGFYRIDGWRPDGSRRLDEIHGVTVDEVRYRRALP